MSQKRKKHHRQQQRRSTELSATIGAAMPAQSSATPVVTTAIDAPKPIAAAQPTAAVSAADAQLMRKDLLKVAIVVTLVIAALVALVLSNHATGWLDRIATELYRWLKLG